MRTPEAGKCQQGGSAKPGREGSEPAGAGGKRMAGAGSRETERARRAELVTGKTLKLEMMEEVQLLALTSQDGTVSTVQHGWQGGRGTETR